MIAPPLRRDAGVAVSTVSDRLQAVDSREALHAVLSALAAGTFTGTARWTCTQVRFFLPAEWRSAVDDYFDGERLRALADLPPQPVPLDAPGLAEALARCAARLGSNQDEEPADDADLPPRTAGLRELLAQPEPTGDTPIAYMLRALREEMKAADSRQQKRMRLSQGRCVRGTEGRFIYQFTWSSEPDPHAPGELRVGEQWIPATVGEAAPDEALRYEVIVDEWLGPNVGSAIFRVDPTFLLRNVYLRLETADASSADAGTWAARLEAAPERAVTPVSVSETLIAQLNARQREAVRMAAGTNRSYVWGPPGTGKTTTIGALARTQVARNRRVLILSPYNVAVDEAVLSVSRGGGEAPRIVRLGRAGPEVRRLGLDLNSQLEQHAVQTGLLDAARELLAAVMARQPGERVSPPSTVRACLDELGALIVHRKAARDDPQARELVSTIKQIRRAFRAPESDLLHGAEVVGCTMALGFLKDELFARPFDHLIIDEASVVRSPEAVLAATCAAAPVTFFGDPKQLPSIVQAQGPRAARWLGRSPFALASISSPADAGGSCVLLDEQHRMAPPIRQIVSTLFYDGALRDGSHAPPHGKILLVDTATSGARATPKLVRLSQSKENLLHRSVVAEILRAIGRRNADARALVLAPFRAQKNAYSRERSTTEALRRAPRFETIHTSQGTEQDVVVLDLVLAGTGVGTRSRMLDDSRNPHLANLLNVAVSRAKHTLVIVGDLELVRREYRGGLLDQLVGQARRGGACVEVAPRLAGLRAALDLALAE